MTAMMTSLPFAPIVPTMDPAYEHRQSLARFIDPATLVSVLNGVRGATFVTLETRTEPKMLAKHPITGEPNPFKGNAVKVSRVNGMVNWTYSNSVNRQRLREDLTPDFAPLPRKWGQRLPNSPLVEHEGRLYVEMKVERSLGHRYETIDGRELDAATVEAYLPHRKPTRQAIEREVMLRDYALTSILSLKMNGTTYLLSHAPAAETTSIPNQAAA